MKDISIKKILILVTILALPGFLYYLLQEKGKNRYRTLSYFGPKVVADTFHSKMGKKIRDTLYHEVTMPILTDQDGKEFDLSTFDDQIFVIRVFYTKAGHASTISNEALKRMSNAYPKNQHIKFLNITLDPAADTPEALKEHMQDLKINDARWSFLSGNRDSINNFVRNKLLLDVFDSDPIGYTNMLVLIDYKHRIRGIYEVASSENVARLQDEIVVLLAEELRNNNDGR